MTTQPASPTTEAKGGHTPGPWFVGETDPARVDARDRFDEYSFAIAACRVPLVAPKQDEIEANARLIAAAPELLEALEALAQFHDSGGECGEAEQVIEAALAAARKARGTA